MDIQEKINQLLLKVEKPARYIGGEPYCVKKSITPQINRFAFCFPDTYEIGMSYLGLQILYHLLNKTEHTYCERVFAPAKDMEKAMRDANIPLFTLETKTPLTEMDLIGFTLQYELSYTNILNMLELAGISLKSIDRTEQDPIIIAGGPCAFNVEPLADFLDIVLIGDGEELLPEICKMHAVWKAEGGSKNNFYEQICHLQGVYIPSFYKPIYSSDGTYIGYEKLYTDAPDRILKAIVADINQVDFPTENIVPLIEIVHDRAVAEIFRGCSRGCRFCQAGMVYRPVRERNKENIKNIAYKQLESSGHQELSLLSLSTSDHSEFEDLVIDIMGYCKKNQIALSLPSLRLDNFSFEILKEIQGIKKTGLTFAPEAGTQRLRDVINKNITENEILDALSQAIELGWTSVKLYFMIGLPTETNADLDGICDLAEKIMNLAYIKNGNKRGKFHVSVSVSNFVPKPHTPFMWSAQDSIEEFERKHFYLKDKLKMIKGVTFRYHGTFTSHLEALFARGDRRLCDILIEAHNGGCTFDAWTEHFNEKSWRVVLQKFNITADYYAFNQINTDSALPWDIIDSGISKAFFIKELQLATEARTTVDCREGCNDCGLNHHTDCKWGGPF
ncbi:MAG: TIGR03960 family B12-binding radical SAM protein [Clostridia bacterium]|nr:TIGR03960 family B12-binding radical SAM protein [Clostridia bacterium]